MQAARGVALRSSASTGILKYFSGVDTILRWRRWSFHRTRTRTNTNPNGTEANAAGRSGNARALRKQSKCGMIQEGEGHWPKFLEKFAKSEEFVGVGYSAEQ